MWWLVAVIPALRMLGCEDQEFEASLGHKGRCLKTSKQANKKTHRPTLVWQGQPPASDILHLCPPSHKHPICEALQ